jgi:RNA polymerase sigma factor (sigma-70 family)
MATSQYTRSCPLAQLGPAPPGPADQLRHAQQGCPDCLNALMAQHDGLVHWVLRRSGRAALPYDEALQSGRLGLWQALLHFDPTRGTTLATYAVPAIRRQVQRASQQAQRFWRALPVLPPVAAPDPVDALVEALDRARLRQALTAALAQLPARLAALLRARYGWAGQPPQTQLALAQTLGVTRQRVQQLLVEAHLRLALPGVSWEVRRQVGRTTPPDIQAALRAWQRWQRRQRRRGR